MEQCGVIDDDEFIESDDLGLGFGLKPGGLPPLLQSPPRTPNTNQNTTKIDELQSNSPVESPHESTEEIVNQEDDVKDILSRLSSWTLSSFLEKFTSVNSKNEEKHCSQLFNHNTGGNHILTCKKCENSVKKKGRRRRNSDSALDDTRNETKESPLRRTKSVREKTWHYFQDKDYKRLQNKLQKAKEEIDSLNTNLEHCQKELLEKYDSMKAMRMHSRLEQAQHRMITKKAIEASKQLEQDVNMLQWELELKQSYLMDSEQTWAQRFDRVASENAALLVALHTRSDELRKLALDRIALIRERDELVAALEVRDRIKGESFSMEDGPYSSEEVIAELATLGACQCRGHLQEPCSCARAAVEAKRELGRVNKQMELSRHNEEEARLTADAYRIAFEQQLNKNTSLIHDLLHKSVPWTKNLLSLRKKPREKHQDTNESSEEEFIKLMRSRDDKLVQRLVDMLSDKIEALAHQKMATKMLASKIREQERVIQKLTTQERVFLPSQTTQDFEPDPPVSV